MISVQRLGNERWQDSRDLRLEALQMEPSAFGSSYEEELTLSEEIWKKRLSNTIFALSEDRLVGMLSLVFENHLKSKHITNIYAVYVKKNERNHGIGSKLMDHALLLAGQQGNIVKIHLSVNPKQEAAVKLYERYGFQKVGRLQKELLINGNFYDEIIMEKML
jgi:ribosomal protein S18 acetylase RimI-like enzyme